MRRPSERWPAPIEHGAHVEDARATRLIVLGCLLAVALIAAAFWIAWRR